MTSQNYISGLFACCQSPKRWADPSNININHPSIKILWQTGQNNFSSPSNYDQSPNPALKQSKHKTKHVNEKISIKNVKKNTMKVLEFEEKIQKNTSNINNHHLEAAERLHHNSLPSNQNYLITKISTLHETYSHPQKNQIQNNQIYDSNYIYRESVNLNFKPQLRYYPMNCPSPTSQRLETTVNKNIQDANLLYSQTTQSNRMTLTEAKKKQKGKNTESVNPEVFNMQKNEGKEFKKFALKAVESKVQKSKYLQQIKEQKNEEYSKNLKIIPMISKLSPEDRMKAKKSQLEMFRVSSVSKNQDQSSKKNIDSGNINFKKQLKQSHRRHHQNFDYSIQSINSQLEEVQASKIKQKVQQSVVMLDFFNPAKQLKNKWEEDD